MGKRMWIVAIASIILIAAPGAPAHARQPIRSGAVAGGPTDTGPGAGCQTSNNPDCVAWLESGCDPDLTGLNTAVTTSIVDVGNLAGRRTKRLFVVQAGTVSGVPAGWVIGGFVIQFWSSRCSEVYPDQAIRDASRDYFPEYIRTQTRFRIPAGAKWMTAAADDNVLIRWEMY
jgi:hypothetical protein